MNPELPEEMIRQIEEVDQLTEDVLPFVKNDRFVRKSVQL